jgi:BTB/POZ domain
MDTPGSGPGCRGYRKANIQQPASSTLSHEAGLNVAKQPQQSTRKTRQGLTTLPNEVTNTKPQTRHSTSSSPPKKMLVKAAVTKTTFSASKMKASTRRPSMIFSNPKNLTQKKPSAAATAATTTTTHHVPTVSLKIRRAKGRVIFTNPRNSGLQASAPTMTSSKDCDSEVAFQTAGKTARTALLLPSLSPTREAIAKNLPNEGNDESPPALSAGTLETRPPGATTPQDETILHRGETLPTCKLLFSERYSDILVRYGGHANEATSIPAHKAILGAASPVWDEFFQKYPNAQCLELLTFPKRVVEETLSFLYRGSLSRKTIEECHDDLSRMARTFQLEGLQSLLEDYSLALMKDVLHRYKKGHSSAGLPTASSGNSHALQKPMVLSHDTGKGNTNTGSTSLPTSPPKSLRAELRHSLLVNGWLPKGYATVPMRYRFITGPMNCLQQHNLYQAIHEVVSSAPPTLHPQFVNTQIANLFNNWHVKAVLAGGEGLQGQITPWGVACFRRPTITPTNQKPDPFSSSLLAAPSGGGLSTVPTACASFDRTICSSFLAMEELDLFQKDHLWVALNHVLVNSPPNATQGQVWIMAADIFNSWHIQLLQRGVDSGLGGQVFPPFVRDFLHHEVQC